MTNVLIKSHSYTINLANVLSIRSHEVWNTISQTEVGHTRFIMKDEYVVQITCPYDIVMKQISKVHWMRESQQLGTVRIIELDY